MTEFGYEIGEAGEGDLEELLSLYLCLNPSDPVLEFNDALFAHWRRILDDPNLYVLVARSGDQLIGTCHLATVPNLTRGMRPYGLIENVITLPNFRRRGVGIGLLQCGLDTAWSRGCYKVMLLTGRKDDAILRFYEKSGFESGVKTGFVAYPIGDPTPPPVQTSASDP